jgi:hypothetical protein
LGLGLGLELGLGGVRVRRVRFRVRVSVGVRVTLLGPYSNCRMDLENSSPNLLLGSGLGLGFRVQGLSSGLG